MLRSRYVRSFLVNALSVAIGFGLVLIFFPRLQLSQDAEEFWGVIAAFLIAIPVDLLIQYILRRLIGPADL